jgi:hypothetical protein
MSLYRTTLKGALESMVTQKAMEMETDSADAIRYLLVELMTFRASAKACSKEHLEAPGEHNRACHEAGTALALQEENSLSFTVSPTQKKKKKKTPSESGGEAPTKKPRKISEHSLAVGKILAVYEKHEVAVAKRPSPSVAALWLSEMGGNVESLLALLEDLARRCKLQEGGYVYACIRGEAKKATMPALASETRTTYLRPYTLTHPELGQEIWLAQNHEGSHVGLRKWDEKLDGPWPCFSESWRVDQWGSVPSSLPTRAAQLEQVDLLNQLDMLPGPAEPSLFAGVAH